MNENLIIEINALSALIDIFNIHGRSSPVDASDYWKRMFCVGPSAILATFVVLWWAEVGMPFHLLHPWIIRHAVELSEITGTSEVTKYNIISPQWNEWSYFPALSLSYFVTVMVVSTFIVNIAQFPLWPSDIGSCYSWVKLYSLHYVADCTPPLPALGLNFSCCLVYVTLKCLGWKTQWKIDVEKKFRE